MALEIGKQAPAFNLNDQNGQSVSLSEFKGTWLVVYSYPKDNTPGCTTEAKDFTCLRDQFEAEGAKVVGVSPDKPASHLRFIEKQALGLRLLSDPEHEMLEAWGSWGLKKFMGREFMGVIRSTWIVDPKGVIRAVWSPVKVKNHAQEVLDKLKNLVG
jgi:peroxiredoxin Q/BCP